MSEQGQVNVGEYGPAEAMEPVEALRAVLAHVEDEGAVRVGGQCTLCFSYRRMIRATIAKAEAEPVEA